MTNREIISEVRSLNKMFADATLNDRSVLAELRSNAHILINQKTNKRKLWTTATLFTPIDCLEMEPMSMNQCCGANGKDVSRSKMKLPLMLEGDYDYIIQGVYDVGSSQKLNYTPLNRYLNIQKLNLPSKKVYYWIQDGYLVVSSPHVKRAKIVAAFSGDIPYDILYPDCDCGPADKNPCESRLDEVFRCPSQLIGAVKQMTNESLLRNYFKVPVDHTSDDKDDQTNRA